MSKCLTLRRLASVEPLQLAPMTAQYTSALSKERAPRRSKDIFFIFSVLFYIECMIMKKKEYVQLGVKVYVQKENK